MDSDMVSIIKNADVQTKWRVVRKTMARRKPVNGVQLGYIKDLVFYSNWIKDGWISITPQKWVIASACERVDEPPAPPPPTTLGNLVQLLPDYELPEKYRKPRNNVPQTVRLHHYGHGNIQYSSELFAFMLALNPGMSADKFKDISDSWNRKGEKFRDGEKKYPFEVTFAMNTYEVKRRFVWGGGLNVPPGTMMLELDAIHPDCLPSPESVLNGSPYLTYLNTVANGQTRKYPNGAMPKVALVSPVPLFIEEERTRPVTTLRYPYDV